ncbi:DUF4190 domain-containing protein [Nonomuraea sp. SBT364]|uniref:DUF4190 domain-containing protein n=1 Tax=Nonomuraea sp. SBT364 TaxID=1580530 RepID=UPI00069F3815|nr:DUF4190 domain-containing protein [Nonomuraea sp. SBT364]
MSYGDQGSGYGAQPPGGGYGQQLPSGGPYAYGQQPPSGGPYAYGQQPPSGGPYGYPPQYGGPVPPRPTSGMAVASLVLGIVGLLFCGLTSIPGAIVGHIAMARIKRTGEEGQSMAMGGLVTSYITIVLWLILWIFFGGLWLAVFGFASSTAYSS